MENSYFKKFREKISKAIVPCLAVLISTVFLSASNGYTAEYDDSGDFTLDDTVATATKTGETKIQETPISITAFDSESMEKRQITDLGGVLDYTPNTTIQAGPTGQIFMRGIGNDFGAFGTESGVGLYIDGIYVERGLGGTDSFLDIERVEVLRGPQGTLWGRNSTGGAELWIEAGLPEGVLNIVTAGRNEAEIFLKHPSIKGVSFVGSTKVGLHIYSTAAANGKRVQALTEAKNHAMVMSDCKLDRTAKGIMNAYIGCAGARCMALPAICVEESIADDLVALLVKYSAETRLGKAYDRDTGMGPIVNAGHRDFINNWIETGVKEGAKLVLDGRNPRVPEECKNGFWVGPTIFEIVTEGMKIGREEVFGPVLCVKRVKNFEEGITIMNNSRFANGSAIYTQNGYWARQFASRTHAGMVGVNVGIPVPVGIFGFTGHKNSFFGDLHAMGRDGIRFFTEQKNVTSTWFSEEETDTDAIVDTWDGTITSMPDEK